MHPTAIAKADAIHAKHAGTLLVPPLGGERAKQLPEFIAKDIHIEGTRASRPPRRPTRRAFGSRSVSFEMK